MTTRREPAESLLTPLDRAFGDYVAKVCGDRGNRELYRLTGVSHTTIGDMRYGVIPSYRMLERFAEGLGLDPRERHELFVRARYVMDGTPAERLLDWLQDYERRWGKPLTLHFRGGAANLTHEDVDKIVALHEREAEEAALKSETELTERVKE